MYTSQALWTSTFATLLRRSLLLLAVTLLPLTSRATPVFLYQFEVGSCVVYGIYAPPGSPCNDGTLKQLESSYIALTFDAVRDGYASYFYRATPEGPPPIYLNDGVVDARFPNPTMSGFNDSYVPPVCKWCGLDLKVSLTENIHLLDAGFIDQWTIYDSTRMTGSEGVWSGKMSSDDYGYGGDFTGSWKLAGALPEPSTLALVLLGIPILIARRRAAR
jgi:hypothetical protein